MKVKIDPNNDAVFRPFLMILASKGGQRHENPEFDKLIASREALEKQGQDSNEYDIVLTVNGIEFDYLAFTHEYIRQMDDLIKDKAGNLIDVKVSDLADKLEYLHGLLDQAGRDAKDKLQSPVSYEALRTAAWDAVIECERCGVFIDSIKQLRKTLVESSNYEPH